MALLHYSVRVTADVFFMGSGWISGYAPMIKSRIALMTNIIGVVKRIFSAFHKVPIILKMVSAEGITTRNETNQEIGGGQ